MLIAGGLVTIAIGVEYQRRGIFSFPNASYHQTVFSGGVIGSGVVMVALAFLPSGDWIYRHITTKRNIKLSHHTRLPQNHKTDGHTRKVN
jgi:hypothetical protein